MTLNGILLIGFLRDERLAGDRMDEKPDLRFHLCAVDHQDPAADLDKDLPLTEATLVSSKILETDDMAALFGLDMASPGEESARPNIPPNLQQDADKHSAIARELTRAKSRFLAESTISHASKSIPHAKNPIPQGVYSGRRAVNVAETLGFPHSRIGRNCLSPFL